MNIFYKMYVDFLNSKMLKYKSKLRLIKLVSFFLGSKKRRELRNLIVDDYDERLTASLGIFFNVKTFNDKIEHQKNHSLHEASNNYFIESNLKKISVKKSYQFLDAGCGSGYVCWKASSYFSKVIGVEFMPELAKIAESNLQKLKINNVEIINDDICNISIDVLKNINVVYMYNPFVGEIMDTFIANLVESIRQYDRDVYVIYVNDVCKDILEKYADVLPLKQLIEDKNWRDSRIYFHKKA